MESKVFDVVTSVKAQADYCKTTGAPHFAPVNGVCWNCRKNIYKELPRDYGNYDGTKRTVMCGIDVEKATNQLVTGCPHCDRSYCD